MVQKLSLLPLPPYEFKICILGAEKVGKTSLVRAFFGQKFVEKHTPTVDDYYVHEISLERAYYRTCIIDTAGSHTFPVMQKLAIEISQGFLVVYALDSEKSFVEALRLLDEIFTIKTEIDSLCRRITANLVATKLDIDCREREVSQKRALDAMKVRPWIVGEHMEISSKAGFRAALAFHSLVKNIVTENLTKEKKKGRMRMSRKMRNYKCPTREKKKKRKLTTDCAIFSKLRRFDIK